MSPNPNAKLHDDVADGGGETTATEAAYNAILDLILRRQLRVGERTSVNLLADRLGVGKTPIKEAIVRLRTEGLLTVSGRSGTTVNEISQAQALEMFGVRHLLEDYVADAIIANIDPTQLAALHRVLATMRALTDPGIVALSAEFVKANKSFHSQMVAASGNSIVSRLYDQLQIQSQIMSFLIANQPEALSAARLRQQEHEDMLAAIERRDATNLRTLMREHTVDSQRAILQQLGQQEPRRRRP